MFTTEPGIDLQDQRMKGVTYTCQIKDSLHSDYLLPRQNNVVLGLSKSHKTAINLLNTHGIALELFLDLKKF